MVTEEADAGTRAANKVVEAHGLARPVQSASMPRKHDARRCIMGEEHVEPLTPEQRVDVLPRVVPLGVALEVLRPALVVRGTVATTQATDNDTAEVEGRPVAEVEEVREHLRLGLGVEPDEVLVVALDEQRAARGGPSTRPPSGEVARAVVLPGGLVDALRVRPHAEVADMQHPLEAHAERLLEGEDVLEEPIEGSVDVASGADDHGSFTMPAVGGQSKLGALTK